ncbi:MAG TPA: hypothetical protein VER39_12050 [Nocardioidaceae bacterium]|nr:hypothetical protein [Nocardioidaceae bacterium]
MTSPPQVPRAVVARLRERATRSTAATLETTMPVRRMLWPLPSGTPAGPAARGHVAAATGDLDSDLACDARSLTSEVVTAALLRGHTDELWLEVAVSRDTLHVEVTASLPHPVGRLVSPQVAGSRGGLLIVDALASEWGLDEESAPPADTLRIWFRLSLA